ncbi:MAG: AI-2E family transporter [Herpetosiphonaceae bacterium]|nr:AI-2E family transporter [Herpetosiphonaceae bacterium]
MKRLAQVTATIVLTIGLVVLLWMFSSAVLLFVMSLVIAGSVRPLVVRLIARGLSRGVAYALVYILIFAIVGSLIAVTASGLLNELQRAGDQLLKAYTSIMIRWPNGADWQQSVVANLPSRDALLSALAGKQGATITRGVVGVGSGIFDLLAQLVIVLSLSVYWSIDQERFERLWLSLFSARHRLRARTIWQAVEREVGAYVRSEVTQSLLAGIVLGLSFYTIGLPYPILLGLWAGLVWLIPWVGVVLALIPATLVGLLAGPTNAVLAAAVTIAVFAALEVWVEPRLYGRARVSPVLVVITLMVMAQYAGILGMLLAPPLAAMLQILGRELWFVPPAKVVAPDLTAQLIELRTRLASLRLENLNGELTINSQTRNLVQQVETLLDQAHETLDTTGLLPPVDPTPTLNAPFAQPDPAPIPIPDRPGLT